MILILTAPDDLHADRVERKLFGRRAPVFRFDPANFPATAEISVRFDAAGVSARLRTEDGELSLRSVRTIWYRRPGRPQAALRIREADTRRAVAEEAQVVLDDLWGALDCRWVPGPRPALAHRKIAHLKLAAELGFELPTTLVTNRPDDLLELYRETRGHLVSKRAGYSFLSTSDSPFCRYTEVVSPRDVGYAGALTLCPITLQAYVPKAVELRVTVVGTRAFAAEIASQSSNHSRHDWRRYDYSSVRYRRHALPADLERRCIELVRRLDLRFGAIDLVLTPDGDYTFLEINPNGQYLWIEHATGLPISEAVCDLLLETT
jgi:glutathione synthase/RimK-type ligase-like ATP-grasp enzyme